MAKATPKECFHVLTSKLKVYIMINVFFKLVKKWLNGCILLIKGLSKLERITLYVSILWVAIQIVLLFFYWDHPDGNDEKEYIKHAMDVVATGELYPSAMHVYDLFVHAPGWSNWLAVVYLLFETVRVQMVINLLVNVCILVEIFYISLRLFDKCTACIAVIIYCSLCSTWFVDLHMLSDHPSYFLSLTAFCITMSRRWYWVVVAGLIYALSYTIRPTVMAFLVGSVVLMWFMHRRWSHYVLLLVPYFLLLYGIGKYTESRIGIYLNTSSLGGFGMMHGWNEEATPWANMTVFEHKGNSAYIEDAEHMTFAEKDSIWKARAIAIFFGDPVRMLKLGPQRTFRYYSHDAWTQEDVVWVCDYERAIHSDNPQAELLKRHLRQSVFSLTYYVMIILFVLSLFYFWREVLSGKGALLVILGFSTSVTFFFPAEVRGHYAFLFTMVIWASYYLRMRLANKNRAGTGL